MLKPPQLPGQAPLTILVNSRKLLLFQWENHSKSMKLEAQTLAKIRSRINEKVMGCCGTWIDWQYLLDAAALLAKCRYTLQYTYPYAYYMEPSPRKELVSCQTSFLYTSVFERFG